jgi:RNA polymerase sigma factor (sigma-70 family)
MEASSVLVNPDAASLYSSYGGLLRWVATVKYRVPEWDAEPLVHEVFVSYLLVRRPLVDVERWLVGGICNQCRNYWRSQARRESLGLAAAELSSTDFEAQVLREYTVARVLGLLDERCRSLLQRHYFQEETARELAESLSLSPGYAQRLIHKCLVRARSRFEKFSRGIRCVT